MGKYFGTDGIRGVVNKELDVNLAFKVGKAVAHILAETSKNDKIKILIGKDTRVSSDMLESALMAGICSVGADVELLGFIPTPAVAYLTIKHKADAGIMISASHNTFEYNGIKIFGPDGYKIQDEIEARIEGYIDDDSEIPLVTHEKLGRLIRSKIEPIEEYVDFIASTIVGDLSGLRVAVDCANGSASTTAAKLFRTLECNADIRFYEPDGININEGCGSTHLENLVERMKTGNYDVGVAFDGDADRCLVVDDKGEIVDGDRIMAICAADMHAKGKLRGNAFVATILSNMGLHAYAKERGMTIECANVGDRYVLEMMRKYNYILGGEQSGHVIFMEYATTGDGQLTAIQLLSILKNSGKKSSEISHEVRPYPQLMINVKVPNELKHSLLENQDIVASIKEAEVIMGDGRVLVRPSGTEPLVRVMCEGISMENVEKAANLVANAVEKVSK